MASNRRDAISDELRIKGRAENEYENVTSENSEPWSFRGSLAACRYSRRLAFAKAIGKRPELEFYQLDKRHPTLIGTYLAASTAYASIYKKSPAGNSYVGGIDPKTGNFLQSVAWETVQEYFGKSRPVSDSR